VRSVANVVYEVKNGRIRKFPGGFDYYFEKKDRDEVIIEQRKTKVDPGKSKQEEERLRTKELEKKIKEEEKKRKIHNTSIRAEISKLEKKKENLQLESYAKARSLSSPKFYSDEDKAREYGRRLKEIEKEITGIDLEIKKLESQII